MGFDDLATLGIDVLPSTLAAKGGAARPMSVNAATGGQFVLTRLHVRYTKESLGEDITFKAAPPIFGGREVMGPDGNLEHGAQPSGVNNFQARYAIRHGWAGPIGCTEPHRGVWGGKPGGTDYEKSAAKSAAKLGLEPHVKTELATFVKQDLPEIGFTKASVAVPVTSTGIAGGSAETAKKGCLGCAVTEVDGSTSTAWLAGLAGVVLAARRRRKTAVR